MPVGFNDFFAAGITTFDNLDTVRSRVESAIHVPRKDWIFAFQGNCNTSYQRWENAALELKTLLKLITKTKKDSAVNKKLIKIHLLFKEQDQITIIDNNLLNSQLTDLANGIGNKRENDKKIEDISKALYD